MAMPTLAAEAAAAAQCNYQAGRFSNAIVEFERCDEIWNQRYHDFAPLNDKQQQNDDIHQHQEDEIVMADDGDPIIAPTRKRPAGPVRVEFIALPPLARRADIAICRFRSAVSSGVGESSSLATAEKSGKQTAVYDNASLNDRSTSSLLRGALETNDIYLQALKGAAMSLVRTCSMELQAQRQRQPSKITSQRNRNHRSIQKAMRSTSLAILMTGIAASHLRLYHTESSTQINNGNDNSRMNPWNVLVDAAVLAADLMQTRKDWMDRIHEIAEDDDAGPSLETTKAGRISLLEESLCILNETLCSNNRSTNSNDEENERGAVAMHSFRSALKVAALATGKKLILPKPSATVPLEKPPVTYNRPPPKRRKVKKDDEESNCSKKDTCWNAKYLHSNPLLHSRDRVVDALSFHSAAIRYPKSRDIFIEEREVCFEEAVKWEHEAGALYNYNTNAGIESGGCAGYAWKLRNCLNGMELVTDHASFRGKLESNDEQQTRRRAVLQSLELLASSSSSQYACDLLGCLHAKRGDFSRAIEKFQLSLDHGESRFRHDADEESGVCLAERRTIVNMALCFLSMGEVNTPLELLLHLWMVLSEAQPSTSNSMARPMALLLSSSSNGMESMFNSHMHHYLDHSTKMQLLWMLFHVSSLAQDWGTCLTSIEEMSDGNDSIEQHNSHNHVARSFALLQCRRPSAAEEICHNLVSELASRRNKGKPGAQLLLVMAELYNADALLIDDQNTGFDDDNEITPLDCTQRASDELKSVLQKINNANDVRKVFPPQELQVTIHNDQGIALLMAGDSVGALRSFREAAKHITSSTDALANIASINTAPSWLLLPTYFNLSLLLLRDGHVEESAKSWLQARGYFLMWQNTLQGDGEALRNLKDLRELAINRHGLLMAKRSMMQGGDTIWDQENIMEWVAPVVERGDVQEDSTRVGGVDASQITAMDVVLLRYAVSNAEKKVSSSFRRGAGLIGF